MKWHCLGFWLFSITIVINSLFQQTFSQVRLPHTSKTAQFAETKTHKKTSRHEILSTEPQEGKRNTLLLSNYTTTNPNISAKTQNLTPRPKPIHTLLPLTIWILGKNWILPIWNTLGLSLTAKLRLCTHLFSLFTLIYYEIGGNRVRWDCEIGNDRRVWLEASKTENSCLVGGCGFRKYVGVFLFKWVC